MPDTQYVRSGDVHIAYQVFGNGPDLVLIPGYATHVELVWDHPPAARFLDRLAGFGRVLTFDRRGSGLSDRVDEPPPLEQRMDDVRAVMDAAGSDRATLIGVSEGAIMALLFAAAHPDRVERLILVGGMARSTCAEDYPWANTEDALRESAIELLLPSYGSGSTVEIVAPSQAENEATRQFFGRLQRTTATPGMLGGLVQMFLDLDVRDVVPAVHCPALVLHATRDRLVNIGNARWLADNLPDARLLEIAADDHIPWYECPDAWLDPIEEFVTGVAPAADRNRRLTTVLFTDIVDSTRTGAELGDQAWRQVLERHYDIVRGALAMWRGREIKTIGDGFLATFDGPGRGVRCARQIVRESRALGIRIRAGLHTGEVEVIGEDISGMTVNIAARVSALAGADEVLVSQAVRDLVAGTDVRLEARGPRELKGVPGSWEIYEEMET